MKEGRRKDRPRTDGGRTVERRWNDGGRTVEGEVHRTMMYLQDAGNLPASYIFVPITLQTIGDEQTKTDNTTTTAITATTTSKPRPTTRQRRQ